MKPPASDAESVARRESANAVTLVVVPEPSTLAILAAVALVSGKRRRRH